LFYTSGDLNEDEKAQGSVGGGIAGGVGDRDHNSDELQETSDDQDGAPLKPLKKKKGNIIIFKKKINLIDFIKSDCKVLFVGTIHVVEGINSGAQGGYINLFKLSNYF